MRHVVIGVLQAPAHTLQLQLPQGFFAGRLYRFQVHVYRSYCWLRGIFKSITKNVVDQ
jgi:hypothetical protein